MKKDTKSALSPIIMMLLFAVAIFAVYGVTRYIMNQPHLFLDVQKKETTSKDSYLLKGSTSAKSKVQAAGHTITSDNNGKFKILLPLQDGLNTFKVTAAGITKNVSITKKVAVAKSAPPKVVSKTANNNLATSGPVENIMGSIGLTAIIFSFYIYFRSRAALYPAQRLFT